jgi:hypothetical protein
MRRYLLLTCVLSSAMMFWGCDDDSYTDEPLPNTVTSQTIVGDASITGTILAIEPQHQRVTITCDDGVTRTFVVGKDVGNLSEVAVGDRVAATFTKKLSMFVSNADSEPGIAGSDSLAKVTDGSQATARTSEMLQVTWRVVAVDAKDRSIRLEDPTGEVHDCDVPAEVDFDAINIGDDIVARFTETISVLVKTS